MPFAVARLCSKSYPAADHRYQLLQADDMGFKNILATFSFENQANVNCIHPHLLMGAGLAATAKRVALEASSSCAVAADETLAASSCRRSSSRTACSSW